MNPSAKRTLPVLLLVFVSAYAWVGAQAPARKALGVDDYTRWRSISGQEISGDGAWVTYGVAITNVAPNDTKPVLHLLNLATNQDVEVANATGGTFSADSKWIAYRRAVVVAGADEVEAAVAEVPHQGRPRRRLRPDRRLHPLSLVPRAVELGIRRRRNVASNFATCRPVRSRRGRTSSRFRFPQTPVI